jgi:hypothetical protein
LVTIAIKDKDSSSKSLFPNLSKHTYLMAKESKKKAYSSGGTSWVVDSGCTNHMIEERSMFTSFEKNNCESDCITFGDNSQGQLLGFGKIAITTKHSIFKVLLVESLDYNLLSISQLCEMGYNCLFTNKGVTVFRRSDGSFAFEDVLRGKLYLVDFIPEEVELDR